MGLERGSVRSPFLKEVGVRSKGHLQMTVLVLLKLHYIEALLAEEIKAL